MFLSWNSNIVILILLLIKIVCWSFIMLICMLVCININDSWQELNCVLLLFNGFNIALWSTRGSSHHSQFQIFEHLFCILAFLPLSCYRPRKKIARPPLGWAIFLNRISILPLEDYRKDFENWCFLGWVIHGDQVCTSQWIWLYDHESYCCCESKNLFSLTTAIFPGDCNIEVFC